MDYEIAPYVGDAGFGPTESKQIFVLFSFYHDPPLIPYHYSTSQFEQPRALEQQIGTHFFCLQNQICHIYKYSKMYQFLLQPLLKWYPIDEIIEAKFIGLTFDHRLTWRPHILQPRKRCLLALNILKMVKNSHHGPISGQLITIYRTLIRSKINYG